MCDDTKDKAIENAADALDDIETIVEANDLFGFIQLANTEYGLCSYVFPKWSGLKANGLCIELDMDISHMDTTDDRLDNVLEALYTIASLSSSGLRRVRKIINEIHAMMDKNNSIDD